MRKEKLLPGSGISIFSFLFLRVKRREEKIIFKNIAENSPVLVREMNRLFLVKHNVSAVCLQKQSLSPAVISFSYKEAEKPVL